MALRVALVARVARVARIVMAAITVRRPHNKFTLLNLYSPHTTLTRPT